MAGKKEKEKVTQKGHDGVKKAPKKVEDELKEKDLDKAAGGHGPWNW